MELVDRLKKYIEHLDLQISQFADIAKIPRPTLSQILTGRNKKISNELLVKLHNAFPRLNISWLLFGDGDMEINGLPKIVNQKEQDERSKKIANQQNAESADASSLFQSQSFKAQDETYNDAEPIAEVGFESEIHKNIQPIPVSISPDTSKHIQSIMVFYSDNSFEIFKPSQR